MDDQQPPFKPFEVGLRAGQIPWCLAIKPDEVALFNLVKDEKPHHPIDFALAAETLKLNLKRVMYIVAKWTRRGWLDCGTSPAYSWWKRQPKNFLDTRKNIVGGVS